MGRETSGNGFRQLVNNKLDYWYWVMFFGVWFTLMALAIWSELFYDPGPPENGYVSPQDYEAQEVDWYQQNYLQGP